MGNGSLLNYNSAIRSHERHVQPRRTLPYPTGWAPAWALKGMERGVEEALVDIRRAHGLDWTALKPSMRAAGKEHVETY